MGRKAGGLYINPKKFANLQKPCMKEMMSFLSCFALCQGNDERCSRQKSLLSACMEAQAQFEDRNRIKDFPSAPSAHLLQVPTKFKGLSSKMLTCIAVSKQGSGDESPPPSIPTKTAIKALSSQIKNIALKARHCTPCSNQTSTKLQQNACSVCESDMSVSDRFRWSYGRTAGRRELESRLKGISSGEATPSSSSGRSVDPVVFVEEIESKGNARAFVFNYA